MVKTNLKGGELNNYMVLACFNFNHFNGDNLSDD